MSARFSAHATAFGGVICLDRTRMGDERGYLSRLFCADELATFGWRGGVSQINETFTRQSGTVRGLHFQHPPHGEYKLVTCLSGRILDVVVDIRRGSPDFLKHWAVELSGDNARSLLIPTGFAHGFQTLTADVRLAYVHSAPHRAEAEGGLRADDPRLGIDWPLPIGNLSARDGAHALIGAEFTGVEP